MDRLGTDTSGTSPENKTNFLLIADCGRVLTSHAHGPMSSDFISGIRPKIQHT
jgi:hypothetical protein